MVHDKIHDLIDVHPRGVHHDGVGCLGQRRDGAHRVAPIALVDLGQDLRKLRGRAILRQVSLPSCGAHLRGRGEVEFCLCVGEHHRSDVSPFEHHTPIAAQLALDLEQVLTDLGDL